MSEDTRDHKSLGLSYFGPASFLKAPIVTPGEDWAADVAFLGIPFDQGAGFRPGARWGPRAIRDMSVRFAAIAAPGQPGYWDLRSGRDRATCSIVDCGDIDIVPLLWEANFEAITTGIGTILEKGTLPVIAGGDHAVTFPCVRAYEGRGPLTVVHVDAHLDYRDEAMGVRYGHGNVLRRVRELPFVERVISVGIRSLRTRREDAEAHHDDGNVLVPAWDIRAAGVEPIADRLPRDARVYLTFDIDALDPAIAPGTGTPEVGGLTYEQARRILELVFTRNEVVGLDLVEVSPSYDPTQVTALLAAQILVEAIGFRHHR